MPLEPLWTGSQLLRKLLDDFLSGKLNCDTFCRDVVVAYNDAIDDKALTVAEQSIFERLFREVAYYSPFPEERARIPNYRNEAQVTDAALAAHAELRGS